MTNLSKETWFQDPALTRIMTLINADGGEGRVVGGAVRNSLMGLEVGDIDMATTLLPQTVIERAKAADIKAVPTGIDHGTVTLVLDGRGFEVTTLRRDVATDGRHAAVAFGTDWQVDAERRDLTINALYVDQAGEVIDLLGGIADIETKTVRFIGDAEARIAEDYLRVLRFFRFFALYGSGRPDADGLRASARAKGQLSTLSAERVWSELKKLLSAEDPGRALLWMRQSGVLGEILPETEKWGIDAIPGLVAAEKALGWSPDPLLRLGSIVPKNAERLKALAARLRLSKAEAAFLDQFARAPAVPEGVTDIAFDRMLYEHGTDGIAAQLRLDLALARAKAVTEAAALARAGRLSSLLSRAEAFSKPEMPVGGADVLAAGIAAGPEVGRLLGQLEIQWMQSNFTLDREKLLARLRELIAG
ncbi:MAG: CCA tRNA nucleotidyltransferase [Allorhizobium sp.]